MPGFYVTSTSRGLNMFKARREELREVATTRAEALVQKGKLLIDASEASS